MFELFWNLNFICFECESSKVFDDRILKMEIRCACHRCAAHLCQHLWLCVQHAGARLWMCCKSQVCVMDCDTLLCRILHTLKMTCCLLCVEMSSHKALVGCWWTNLHWWHMQGESRVWAETLDLDHIFLSMTCIPLKFFTQNELSKENLTWFNDLVMQFNAWHWKWTIVMLIDLANVFVVGEKSFTCVKNFVVSHCNIAPVFRTGPHDGCFSEL